MNENQISRRHFLSTSTIAAAGLAVAGGAGALLAADEKPTASNDAALRWGIIGTGTRGGSTHVPVQKLAPESQTLALCDVDEGRLKAAASKVGHPVAEYADYQKLLANPDINAVVIATPNLFHREMFQAAIQAGKHVLCEKPAGASPADAVALNKAADAAKTVIMFGMQYRNHEIYQQMRAVIDSGRIGKPRYIVQNVSRGDWNTNANVWQYADPKLGGKPMNWRFSQTASGGTLNEFSCHYFDLMHWMAGSPAPESLIGEGGISVYHDGRDTWDHASVTMKYPGGVIGVHTLCIFGPNAADLLVIGENGSVQIKDKGLLVSNRAVRGANKGAKSQQIAIKDTEGRGTDGATLGLYRDFLDCLKTGKKPIAGVDRATAASRTCWLTELSAQRKAEVRWDELA